MKIVFVNRCCGKGYKHLTAMVKHLRELGIESTHRVLRSTKGEGKYLRQAFGFDKSQPVITLDGSPPFPAEEWESHLELYLKAIDTRKQTALFLDKIVNTSKSQEDIDVKGVEPEEAS
jgi:hypothetical protein